MVLARKKAYSHMCTPPTFTIEPLSSPNELVGMTDGAVAPEWYETHTTSNNNLVLPNSPPGFPEFVLQRSTNEQVPDELV